MKTFGHHGLRRIVVMESANVAYADIEVGGVDSTQFVGSNGLGKTTLINVLQFLYVPKEKKWHFGDNALRATKEHYFPTNNQPYARILFEVMTPTGPAIIGVRRKQIGSTELEHFYASGSYEKADFFDEKNTCRPWEDVHVRLLVAKNFKVINDLENCLTGNEGTVNLGLVPLRKGEHGDLFEKKFLGTFLRLFRLSTIDQAAMQETLIDLALLPDERQFYNPAKSLDQVIHKCLQQFDELTSLGKATPDIESGNAIYEELLEKSAWISAAHATIHSRHRAEVDRVQAELPQLSKELGVQEAAAKELALQVGASDLAVKTAEQKAAKTNFEIERIEGAAKAYRASNFSPDFTRLEYATQQGEAKALADKLAVASFRPLIELEDEVTRLQNQVNEKSDQENRFGEMLVTHLRTSGLDDEIIIRAFSVLEPDLLKKMEGRSDGVIVSDQPELVARIRKLAEHVNEKSDFHDEVLRIRVSFNRANSTVKSLVSVEQIRADLTALRPKLEQAKQILEHARDIESRRKILLEIEGKVATLKTELDLYDLHRAEVGTIPELKRRLSVENSETAQLKQHNEVLRGQAEDQAKVVQGVAEKIAARGQELNQLRDLLVSLQLPEILDDVVAKPEIHPNIALLTLAEEYRTRHAHCSALKERWTNQDLKLENLLGDRYRQLGATPRAIFKRLGEEIENLAATRSRVQREFHAILSSVSRSFQNLLDGLQDLKLAASRLTDAFSKVSLSNIEYVKCIVEPAGEIHGEIEEHAKLDPELSLFTDEARAKRTIDRALERWRINPQYRIQDIFQVRLVIKVPGRDAVSHHKFDSASGSNGQVITLKVLVNLMVLATQLHPKREAKIPFYIDEVLNLDDRNFLTLQRFAREHGFHVLYASTESKKGIERFYRMRGCGGRLFVDDSCRMDAKWVNEVPASATPEQPELATT